MRSGHASFKVFAYEEARSHWENALDLTVRHNCGGAEQRASILWLYSEAALALYEQLGDERGAALVHSRLAGQLSHTAWPGLKADA